MYSVMVIDDSPFIVDVFVTMLERGGYQAIAAYSGEEGLEILKTVTPDLILLDIMMEPMDGWETLENIKINPKTREVPVLMLTAKQLTPDEAEGYGSYIEDYILKPITHRELYEAIERVLQRREMIRSDVENAQQVGLDQHLVDEYTRLAKGVDVNSRLLRILETTYNIHDSKASEKISLAIKNMENSIKFQENRLTQIKEQIKALQGKQTQE
ncbi:CheY-like chemotaxis protein [Methanofollis sp. W23]|uniref:response regulator n=1 Tax=Methanofollis sp. W23 TaxID=2817849 RepID=UPI001AE48B34|nr:response regulator [Methanofollis sp. W23]MBP2146075.1 CheY-like chemotaxis protein [Methanofollis sp. W23]